MRLALSAVAISLGVSILWYAARSAIEDWRLRRLLRQCKALRAAHVPSDSEALMRGRWARAGGDGASFEAGPFVPRREVSK